MREPARVCVCRGRKRGKCHVQNRIVRTRACVCVCVCAAADNESSVMCIFACVRLATRVTKVGV